MGRLQDKVAVVTGASKGIGAGIARALGESGASVVVNYGSDKAGAEKVVADIKAKGGKAVAVKADVSRSAEVKRLFEETRKTFGKLDVLVNNAGVYKFAPIEETSEAEYQRQFGINVLGPLLATREALPLFGSAGGSVTRRAGRREWATGGDRAEACQAPSPPAGHSRRPARFVPLPQADP